MTIFEQLKTPLKLLTRIVLDIHIGNVICVTQESNPVPFKSVTL